MTSARLVTLVLLDAEPADAGLRLMELCMSVSVLGADMRLATKPEHVMHAPRRGQSITRVLILAGLDAPEHDAIELLLVLCAQPHLGLIAIADRQDHHEQALSAGADLAMPASIDRDAFLAEVQWLLDVYAPASAASPVDTLQADPPNVAAPSAAGHFPDTLVTMPATAASDHALLPHLCAWRLESNALLLHLPNARSIALGVCEHLFLRALFLSRDAQLEPRACRHLFDGFGAPVLWERFLMRAVHGLRKKCLAAGVHLPLQGHPRHGYVFLESCSVLPNLAQDCGFGPVAVSQPIYPRSRFPLIFPPESLTLWSTSCTPG